MWHHAAEIIAIRGFIRATMCCGFSTQLEVNAWLGFLCWLLLLLLCF